MADQLIRIYQNLDVLAIKPHLMIYGDLGGTCANCQNMDVKIGMVNCPGCQTDFQFIAFRNIKTHIPKVKRIMEDHPQIKIIDFDDYKRNEGASKAENFFK